MSHALIMGKFMSSDYKYKRVLLKISGEALMGSQAYGIDTDTLGPEISSGVYHLRPPGLNAQQLIIWVCWQPL